jgi:hypothetical protein
LACDLSEPIHLENLIATSHRLIPEAGMGRTASVVSRAWSRPPSYGKLESTVTYLGIEVDDAVEIAEQTEV